MHTGEKAKSLPGQKESRTLCREHFCPRGGRQFCYIGLRLHGMKLPSKYKF